MDARKLALLKALDDAARAKFSAALLDWQKSEREKPADQPRRDPPPRYIETRTALERIACDLGLTLNDVVNAALGRRLRSVIEMSAASIVEKIPTDVLELVRPIQSVWPDDEPEFIAPATGMKPPKPVETPPTETAPAPSATPKTGPKRARKTKVTEQANADADPPQEAPIDAPVTQASVRPTEGQP